MQLGGFSDVIDSDGSACALVMGEVREAIDSFLVPLLPIKELLNRSRCLCSGRVCSGDVM